MSDSECNGVEDQGGRTDREVKQSVTCKALQSAGTHRATAAKMFADALSMWKATSTRDEQLKEAWGDVLVASSKILTLLDDRASGETLRREEGIPTS